MVMKRTRFLLVMSVMVSLLALSSACGRKKGGEDVVNRGETEKTVPSPKSEETEKAASLPSKSEVRPLKTFQFETVKVDANGNVTERRKGRAQGYSEVINGVQLEMVLIPAGTFQMGSPATEEHRSSDEGPQHQVTVQQFYLGKHEVTQAQWRAVAGLPKVKIDLNPDPSNFKGDNLPVEYLSWDEAVEFCARLSKGTGREYRLPNEAEWEYAARAGTQTPFAFGETITPDIVNYDGRFPYAGAAKGINRDKTTAVGSLGVANGFGLYDMHGNVNEWCQDVWHDSYEGAPTDGSAWESGGEQVGRVLRGGTWNSYGAWLSRSAARIVVTPGLRHGSLGFRVVAVARQ